MKYTCFQGESIHDAVYGLPWYNEDIQDRKELVFMLTATSKPLDLNYRSFVLFDRAQFLNVSINIFKMIYVKILLFKLAKQIKHLFIYFSCLPDCKGIIFIFDYASSTRFFLIMAMFIQRKYCY